MIDEPASHFDGFPDVWMLQSIREFQLFWSWLAHSQSQTVRQILEVGSFCGGTLWYWSKLPGIRRVVSVDQLVHPRWPESRQAQIEARVKWSSWFKPGVLVQIEGDSHDREVIADAAQWGEFDLAFIDGDHSYDGVHADFDAYAPMVRRGGIIAFHDVCRYEEGVMRLADELHESNMTVRFYDPRTDGSGILAVIKTW